MIKGYLYEDEFNKARRVTTKSGRVIVPFVMFETPNSQYSDYAVKEDTPQGEESSFLGNASIVVKSPKQDEPEQPF